MSEKFSSLVFIPFAKATKLVGLYNKDGKVTNCTVDPTSVITTEDLQTNLQKYVTLNTAQTIDSTKIFTQPITIQFSTDVNSNTFKDYIFLKDTSLDYTVTSQFNKTYYTNSLRDKNGKYIGYTEIKYNANGSSSHSMCARTRRDNGNEITASIGVTVNKDGTVKTISPTPPINDNSTQIATTNWVINKLNTELTALKNRLDSYENSTVKKDDLIDSITPNYSNGTNIMSQNPYTVKQKGIIKVKAGGSHSGSFSINNSEVFKLNQSSRYAQPNMHFHVNIGDIISWNNCDDVVFYPYIKQ